MAKVESRENLTRKVASSRHSLLLILIFTVINMVLTVLDSGTYFLFSISVPYYLTVFGMLMDYGVPGTFTVTGIVIGAVILVIYLLCWLLSKKKSGWLCTALVLFLVDTAALALFTFTLFEDPASRTFDFLFHIWVIWDLIKGFSASKKLKKLPAQEEQIDMSVFQGTLTDTSDHVDL